MKKVIVILIVLAVAASVWFFIFRPKEAGFGLPSVNPMENFRSANPFGEVKINPFENVYKNPFR